MFNLTHQERQVILFLSIMALVGLGLNSLSKRYMPMKSIVYMNKDIGKIDINHADKQELISIPGIGEKLAERILDYRKRNCGFGELEELRNIKGFTQYRYEKLKDLLKLR